MRIAIDIGGTFTDFVVYDPHQGTIQTFKLPANPGDPADVVFRGLDLISRELAPGLDISREIIHGSTVATNALLEHKGVDCAFIATEGFKDILEIGRQNRPVLYDFFIDPPEPLVPPERRFEVFERIGPAGEVLLPLDDCQVKELVSVLSATSARSVSICLLFSFLHPEHEERLSRLLRQAGFFVSSSIEILPEFREYERASTTTVNAYVSPVMDVYLNKLEDSLGDTIRVMQSNGGSMGIGEARRLGVHCILSGPAGGVIGAASLMSTLGNNGTSCPKAITFDMGGTSTDVSLIDGSPHLTYDTVIAGYPIRIPLLDIHTIGAGGGSIARVDSGGALRVGPQSAGASPGPACYGQGESPTVTDANLVLGRLIPEYFLGGAIQLYPQRSWEVISQLGRKLQLDPLRTALGIVDVANAHMERALRLISVERGHDPRGCVLFSFGGAGGLHAVDLARSLGIPRVIISPFAATLSAYGMLASDVIKDYSQTVMLPGGSSYQMLEATFNHLKSQGLHDMLKEGITEPNIEFHLSLDIRIRGQSYELTVPFNPDFSRDFHKAHLDAYGYTREGAELEIVNLRLRAISRVVPPEPEVLQDAESKRTPEVSQVRTLTFKDHGQVFNLEIPVYWWEFFLAGQTFSGSCLVARKDTIILMHTNDRAEIDRYGNLMISVSTKA